MSRSKELRDKFDAIVLCGGAEAGRELPVPGRELKGVYQAMYYLPQQNLRDNKHSDGHIHGQVCRTYFAGQTAFLRRSIGRGQTVVVLGGGDTGSDCVGTAIRQGALSVHQFELLPQPPEKRSAGQSLAKLGFYFTHLQFS